MTRLKRLVSPKWWPIEKKTHKFTFASRGAYKRDQSLPLLVFIRDVLKLAENRKEAWGVIKNGEVFVDGKKTKDPNYGLGLFSVVHLPSMNKTWRAIPKNGLSFIEVPDKESKLKLCKIVNKKSLKGNKTQVNLNDGRNILTEEKYSTYDSLLIQVPEQKIVDHIKFGKDTVCMIFKGKNAGLIGKIKTIDKNRLFIGNEETVEVPKDFVIVVGKDEPIIKVE
ncbi:MAG: 30S ribosomal protein S4e [Candidatus Aenigmatarchaeota archaeon]